MKLTIKTFQNYTFKLDIEPDKTVKELKDAIEKEQGKEYPSASQKLIFSGKILSDDNKLSEYEFDEKKFIVLMITRPPPVPKATPTAEQSTSSPKQDADEKSKQSKQSEKKTNTVSAHAANTTTTSSSAAPASIETTASTQRRSETQNPLQSLAAQGAAAAALAEMSALSMGESQISSRLASLMSQPHFRQMQDLIQQSPHLLSSTIESLAASDPEMYNFISENPDIFVSALNHPPMANLRSADSSAQQRNVGGGLGEMSQQGGGGLGVLGQQPVAEQLLGNVTEHDRAAIERLKELGFAEYLAVQAYMACDKDEQLAANLLFQMDQ